MRHGADRRVLVRDALHLDRRDGLIAPRTGRFEAFATLLSVGPRAQSVTRGLLDPSVVTHEVVAAPSPLPGGLGAIVRIAGTSPELTLGEARRRLRNLHDIDVVDPFASRH